MIKAQEKNDPKSCFNKALEGEMLFVLLGRDAVAADTVRYWARRRIEKGLNTPSDSQMAEAIDAAELMEKQAAASKRWNKSRKPS